MIFGNFIEIDAFCARIINPFVVNPAILAELRHNSLTKPDPNFPWGPECRVLP
jgi:hypothetical protein